MNERKWHSAKVLIVDDSAEVRGQLRDFFQQNGFEVVGEAENGIEALSAMDSTNPDLISLDLIMPEMDGMECYQFIKKKSPRTECLFVSILSNDSRVYEAYEESIDSYRFVGKPIRNEALLYALEHIYECYQSGVELEQIPEEDLESVHPEEIAPAENS